MSRQQVRLLKKSIAAAHDPRSAGPVHELARESARYLLDRSIGFGHRRLAVIRLSIAVGTGAALTQAHWAYCREAVERSRDAALRTLLDHAFATASLGTNTPQDSELQAGAADAWSR